MSDVNETGSGEKSSGSGLSTSGVTLPEMESLAHRLETLGRLTAGIAHDFNNLITIVLGYADLLRMQTPRNAPEGELLDALSGAARQAAGLASQLLGLARLRPLIPQPLNLTGLIQDLAELIRRILDRRIKVQVETPSNLRVRGVVCELSQVILNLCLNARDAMPQGGTLTLCADAVTLEGEQIRRVSCRDAGQRRFVRLWIADTGCGIPADVLPRIFDPFFTTRPHQGSGLGLATVQRVVEEHQGWIECASAPGQGTRFDVYLPLLEREGE